MNRLVKGPGKVEGPVKVAFTACLSDGLTASGQPSEKESPRARASQGPTLSPVLTALMGLALPSLTITHPLCSSHPGTCCFQNNQAHLCLGASGPLFHHIPTVPSLTSSRLCSNIHLLNEAFPDLFNIAPTYLHSPSSVPSPAFPTALLPAYIIYNLPYILYIMNVSSARAGTFVLFTDAS